MSRAYYRGIPRVHRTAPDADASLRRMREAHELLTLGFTAEALASARTSIDLAVRHRLGEEAHDKRLRGFKEKLGRLASNGGKKPGRPFTQTRKREVIDFYGWLSEFVHGETVYCSEPAEALERAEHYRSLVADLV